MTNNPSTTDVYEIPSAGAPRRQVRMMQLIFAGAATVATLALFGAAQPGGSAVASGPSQTAPTISNGGGAGGGRVIGVDDGGVNDNGQTSGDIFTQNAQDQSTANGAGT